MSINKAFDAIPTGYQVYEKNHDKVPCGGIQTKVHNNTWRVLQYWLFWIHGYVKSLFFKK